MKNIVVIGSSNTDMVVKTSHLPVPGETVLGGDFFMNAGGKGANQAVAAARYGNRVVFVAKTGNDLFGEQVRKSMKEDGIVTDYVFIDEEHPSGVALITIDQKAENCIVVAGGANMYLKPEDIDKAKEEILGGDVVLMQLETPIETVEYAAKMAAEAGIKKGIAHITWGHKDPGGVSECGIARLTRMADTALENGFLLCLENSVFIEHLYATMEKLKDHPAVRFTYDSGHRNAFAHDFDRSLFKSFNIVHYSSPPKSKNLIISSCGFGITSFP